MITNENLLRRFNAFCFAANAAGILAPAGRVWHLEMGSKTYGRAYRVFWRNVETGGLHHPGGMSDFLGMTKAEAYEALGQRLDALQAAAYAMAGRKVSSDRDGIEFGRSVATVDAG